jgi:2,3-bisphosphoglycerate-dependent phosphoglycerate mutase
MLERATKTADLILEEMGTTGQVEMVKNWKINERHYGSLQGSDKQAMRDLHGDEQVN